MLPSRSNESNKSSKSRRGYSRTMISRINENKQLGNKKGGRRTITVVSSDQMEHIE